MRLILSLITLVLSCIPLVYGANYYYVVNLVSCSNPGTTKPGVVNYCAPLAKYKVGLALVNDISAVVNPLNYTINGGIGPSSGCPPGYTPDPTNPVQQPCKGVVQYLNPGTFLETTKEGFRANITIDYNDNITFTTSDQDSGGINFHTFQLCLTEGCGTSKVTLRYYENTTTVFTPNTGDPRGLSQLGQTFTFQFNRKPPAANRLGQGSKGANFGNYIYYFGANAAKYLGGSITVRNIPDNGPSSAPAEDNPLPIPTYWYNYNQQSGATSIDGLTGYLESTTPPTYNFPGQPDNPTPVDLCGSPSPNNILFQLVDCLSENSVDEQGDEVVSKKCRAPDFTYNYQIDMGQGWKYPYKYTYEFNKDDGPQSNVLSIPYRGNDPTQTWVVSFCLLGNADSCPLQICADSSAGDCGPLTTFATPPIFNPAKDANGDDRQDKGLRLNGDKLQIQPKAQEQLFHFGCATRAGLGGLIRFSAATHSTIVSFTISFGSVLFACIMLL